MTSRVARPSRPNLKPQAGHIAAAGFDLLWRVLGFCFAIFAVGALLVQ